MTQPYMTKILDTSSTRLLVQRPIGLILSLTFGIVMTGCCRTFCKPPPVPPTPVALGKSEIVENEDGTYTVSAPWFARRIEYEKALIGKVEALSKELEDYVEALSKESNEESSEVVDCAKTPDSDECGC